MAGHRDVENPYTQKVSDKEFIVCWQKHGGHTQKVTTELGLTASGMMRRRRVIEKRRGIQLMAERSMTVCIKANRAVIEVGLENGQILIGSDAHIWPNERTVAQEAFIKFAKKFKPDVVVMNGDIFDGARISRFPSIGWEHKPDVQAELNAVRDFLTEVERAAPNAKKYWPAGNHDLRLESRLAAVAPEYVGVTGTSLKDHFPAWTPCWRVDVNQDLVIKHRLANGLHAVYNNTLKSGKSMVTGHLHSLKVTPWTDYTGTRYGVDTGTLAEPESDQFTNYTEAGPTNWRSGFVLLTIKEGRLLWPELVCKFDEHRMEFRGDLVSI
jgi:hypothetical protein